MKLYERMSPEQQEYYDIINKVKTLSYPLSEKILMDIYGIYTPDKAERVLYSLKRMGLITYEGKEGMVQYGGKMLKSIADIDRTTLEAMHIAVECMLENGDGKDAMASLYKRKDGSGITFISNDVVYYTIHINPRTEWTKLKVEERKYQDMRDDDIMRMFIFSAGFKGESIINKLKKENFKMPYVVVLLKNDDVIHTPKFELVTNVNEAE